MTQEFLEQLLRIENIEQVSGHEAPTCMICLEPYGALNSSTGAVEYQIRLPCNHRVGSVCITTWLRDNNSCPACRENFFPAQPRPYLEHGIMNDRPSLDFPMMEGRDETDPEEICDRLCEELALDDEIEELAGLISDRLSFRLRELVHSSECNAATSIYVAWVLLNPDGNVADFLADLSRTAGVSQDLILSTYLHWHPHRMEVIVPQVLPGLARPHMERILAFLPAPDSEVPIANIEEDDRESRASHGTGHNANSTREFRVWEYRRFAEIHGQLGEVVGDTELSQSIESLADQIYVAMKTESRIFYTVESLWHATCVFMACHLMGVEVSYSDVARMHGVSERSLREDYARVFPRCKGFIDPDVAETIGYERLERVIGALPPLNWPPV